MLVIKMAVTYTDGRTAELATRPIDEVRFEAKFDVSYLAAVQAGLSMTQLYWLAYTASGSTLGWDEWLATLAEADVTEVDNAVPFAPGSSEGT